METSKGHWCLLTASPHLLNGNILPAEEFRDNIRLREGLTPLNLPSACDGCGKHFDVEHALTCKKGGLVHIRHDNGADKFAQLCSQAYSHTRVQREPKIHSGTGRRDREVAASESQNSNSTQQPQQQQQQPPTQQQQQQRQQQQQQATTITSDEKRADISCYGFFTRGKDCLFDIRITNTDARSYRNKCPSKVIADQEKEKKDKYLDTCHELRKDFVPLVYSVDGMAGKEARAAEKRLASALAKKWKRPYSQMVQYVKMRMNIAIVRSNSLLLRGSRDRAPTRPFINCGSAFYAAQAMREQ